MAIYGSQSGSLIAARMIVAADKCFLAHCRWLERSDSANLIRSVRLAQKTNNLSCKRNDFTHGCQLLPIAIDRGLYSYPVGG
jgi:hypothetical protein